MFADLQHPDGAAGIKADAQKAEWASNFLVRQTAGIFAAGMFVAWQKEHLADFIGHAVDGVMQGDVVRATGGAAMAALVAGGFGALGYFSAVGVQEAGAIAIKAALRPMRSGIEALQERIEPLAMRELLQSADEIEVQQGLDADTWLVIDPSSDETITLKDRKGYETFMKMATKRGFAVSEITTSNDEIVATVKVAGKLDSVATGLPAIEVEGFSADGQPEIRQVAWYEAGKPSSEEAVTAVRMRRVEDRTVHLGMGGSGY